MTPDQIIKILYKSKRNVQDEITDMAAFIHGWNAAVDHILSLMKGLK